jgi:hypothetical protein
MDPRKKIIIGSVIGVIVVGIAVVVWIVPHLGNNNGNSSQSGSSVSSATPLAAQVTSPVSAYDLALARAKQWESDAAPMEVNLNDVSGGAWTFIFVSQKNKGKGFQVAVNGQAIASANEIVFQGSGTPLPANIISPDDAMAKVRSIPGFANATFVNLQMIYNVSAKQWYWGVKTATGATLTIKATHS